METRCVNCDTLASQVAEAEATMDAYRGTIGQRERDVARLTAQVAQLEQEKAEAWTLVHKGTYLAGELLLDQKELEARIVSLEGALRTYGQHSPKCGTRNVRLEANEWVNEKGQTTVGFANTIPEPGPCTCGLSAALQPAAARAPEAAEQCICAAIQLPNGEVWRGHRHDNCIEVAGKAGATRDDIANAEQGFITSRNRFVGREEGARLQRVAGIVSAHTGRLPIDMLFSEDLYLRAWRQPAPSPTDCPRRTEGDPTPEPEEER